jgi:site-specific DNA recombinase
MMKAVIYARYSSENQREASIDDQIEVCRRLIERQGWQLTQAYTDRSISGANAANRPAFLQMVDDGDNNAFDVIVTEAVDRLGRKLSDVAALFDRLTYLGIKVHTVATGEVSAMQVGMLGTMAQMYLSDLKEKTWRGQLGRVLLGKIPAGRAYGYDIIPSDRPDQGGERRINPAEAAIIVRIFTEYTAGRSARDIVKSLNAEGVPGPEGGTWRDSTIRGQVRRGTGLLNNTLYIGKLIWNRVAYVKHPLTGKRQARINSKDKWETSEVPHLRIIDDGLWQRAKARQTHMRLEMATKPGGNPLNGARRRQFLLSGVVVCGVCGGGYTVVGPDRYGCSAYKHKGTCTNHLGIGRQLLEARVLSGLRAKMMAPQMIEEFARTYHDEINRSAREADARLGQDRKLMAETDRKIASIVSAIEDGGYNRNLKARLDELESKRDEVGRRLANTVTTPIRIHPKLSEIYRKQVEHLAASLDNEGIRREAAEALRGLIDKIVLTPNGEALKVELHGDLAQILAMTQESAEMANAPAKGQGVKPSVVAGT